MPQPKSRIPRPVRPNPSQAEGDLETIEQALRNQEARTAESTTNEESGKVSPEEAARIESYDLPEAA